MAQSTLQLLNFNTKCVIRARRYFVVLTCFDVLSHATGCRISNLRHGCEMWCITHKLQGSTHQRASARWTIARGQDSAGKKKMKSYVPSWKPCSYRRTYNKDLPESGCKERKDKCERSTLLWRTEGGVGDKYLKNRKNSTCCCSISFSLKNEWNCCNSCCCFSVISRSDRFSSLG